MPAVALTGPMPDSSTTCWVERRLIDGEDDGREAREDGHAHRYGGGERPVAGLGHLVGDDVAEHVGVLAADEEGHGVGAEDRDEGEEDGGDEAPADIGQEDLAEGLHPRGAEVAGGLEQGEVELVDRREEGQDGVGQVHVDEDEDDRPLVVEELHRVGREAQPA